jgi:hypothetical protein
MAIDAQSGQIAPGHDLGLAERSARESDKHNS